LVLVLVDPVDDLEGVGEVVLGGELGSGNCETPRPCLLYIERSRSSPDLRCTYSIHNLPRTPLAYAAETSRGTAALSRRNNDNSTSHTPFQHAHASHIHRYHTRISHWPDKKLCEGISYQVSIAALALVGSVPPGSCRRAACLPDLPRTPL